MKTIHATVSDLHHTKYINFVKYCKENGLAKNQNEAMELCIDELNISFEEYIVRKEEENK